MDKIRLHRDQIALLAAVVLPLSVAAILVPFRSSFANTASALILVAVIVAVAAFGNRFAGFVATVSATVWFDFFLTRPYEKLAITHRPDIETAVSLFVVGIIVTELAARSRHHYETATEEADFVGLIHDVSELAVSGASSRAVVQRVSSELIDLLHLRACRYESGATDRPRMRLEHDGRVFLGGRVWGVNRMGLPGPRDRVAGANPRPHIGPLRHDANAGLRGLIRATRRSRSDRRSGRCILATSVWLSCVGICVDRALQVMYSAALAGDQKQGHEEGIGRDDQSA